VTVCCGIQKRKCSVWKDQEVLWQWKELLTVPVYKNGAVTDCSRLRQLHTECYTAYRVLYSILLSRLSPCADEVIEGY